ncbi:MAG TPA: 16S rRNA (guanine(966)-N(2))-methyltransferase RsmD [Actinomycetota bacterium]|nr:16S rRNA (guanine(966)-N(2))-methyltransferase RsmD [Actinomycetota bacterium]
MRVIAGSAGGIPLVAPPKGTRPVSDRAREGVFSSLGDRVVGAVCLDLFAGSGAMGIEGLSRGAVSCTFVEKSRQATSTIARNLAATHLADRAVVVTRDVGSFLDRPPRDDAGVDLVFVDPPYDLAGPALAGVLARLDAWLVSDGWTVVVTRGHKSSLAAVPLHWSARRQLRYGDSLLILYGP